MKTLVLLLMIVSGFFGAANARTWSNTEGKSFDGELTDCTEESVCIRTAKGKEVTIKKAVLSAGDREFIDQWSISQKKEASPSPDDCPPFLWEKSYEAALKKCRKYRLPLLIYFDSKGCGFCYAMKEEILNTAEFKKAARGKFVGLQYEASTSDGRLFRDKFYWYNLFPHLRFLSADGGYQGGLNGYQKGIPAQFAERVNRLIGEYEAARHLALVSYNISQGRGRDGKLSYSRTAEAIVRAGADVAALQEVELGNRSGEEENPVEELERRTGLIASYAQEEREGKQASSSGLLVLSREKPLSVKSVSQRRERESWSCHLLQVEFEKFVVMNVRLSSTDTERLPFTRNTILKMASRHNKPVFWLGSTPRLSSVISQNFLCLTSKLQKDSPALIPKLVETCIMQYQGDERQITPKKTVFRDVLVEPAASLHRPVKVVLEL